MSFKNGPYHSVGQIIVPTKRIAPSPCAVGGHRTKIATFEIPSENNINRKTNSSRAISYYLFISRGNTFLLIMFSSATGGTSAARGYFIRLHITWRGRARKRDSSPAMILTARVSFTNGTVRNKCTTFNQNPATVYCD